MGSPTVEATNLSRMYPPVRPGMTAAQALRDVSVRVESGQRIAVVGPSGSGKSTLLRILGCLDAPDSGRYAIAGSQVRWSSPAALAETRRRHVAFVLQSCLLIPHLTLAENIELPLRYAAAANPRRRALEMAAALGLDALMRRFPHELSGGERQRGAIARAFVSDASIVLADEPTGHLDADNAILVMDRIRLAARRGAAVIIATHDITLAKSCDAILTLTRGRVGPSDQHTAGATPCSC